MRILIYGLNYSPEIVGIAKYTTELAEWLVFEGNDVRVIASVGYFPGWNFMEENKYKKVCVNGVQVYKCPIFLPKKIAQSFILLDEIIFFNDVYKNFC